jgi:hypothetical protein
VSPRPPPLSHNRYYVTYHRQKARHSGVLRTRCVLVIGVATPDRSRLLDRPFLHSFFWFFNECGFMCFRLESVVFGIPRARSHCPRGAPRTAQAATANFSNGSGCRCLHSQGALLVYRIGFPAIAGFAGLLVCVSLVLVRARNSLDDCLLFG